MRVLTKKVALLGDWATGKTSLIRRFVLNMFDDSYIQTIGTKVSKKTVKFYDQDEPVVVNLLIWDLLGQKEYHRIHREAYRGVDGAILVCDLTRKETLESLVQYWHPSLIDVAGKVPVIIAGNKADLKSNLVFGIEEIRKASNPVPETGDNLNTLEDATDYIIIDFVHAIGQTDRGMDIVRMGFREYGLTLKNLKKEKISALVDFLYKKEIESGISEEVGSKNRKRRLDAIARLKN